MKSIYLLALAIALSETNPVYADFSTNFSTVERFTSNGNLDGAMSALQNLNLPSDETLKYLNEGMLLRLQGRYTESNERFEKGKILMQKYQAISLTEQVASVALNDTYKAYEGLPSEQLVVYSMEALNYLQSGRTEDAAVEARQFNVKQGLLAQQNHNAEYLSGAFVRYLNGMIFEANRENDDARIEYQKAIEGYQTLGMPVPQTLRDSLTRVEKHSGKQSEVILIFQNGLGPTLRENKTRIPNPSPAPNTPSFFSIALPEFVPRPAPVSRVELTYGTQKVNSELVEDITSISKKSFDDKLSVIQSRAVARMVAKSVASTLAKQALQQSGAEDKLADQLGLGSFKSLFHSGTNAAIDVAVDATEKADTRTWALLPSNILMARIPVAPAKEPFQVTATYYGANGTKVGEKIFNIASIKKGEKIFKSDYYIEPDSIVIPSTTSYASNSTSKSSSQERESFMFFGFGLGLDPGSGYTDFQTQIYSTSNSYQGSPTYKPDYSIYLGGYSGLIGFEIGFKAIGGYTDKLASKSYNYCTGYYCYQSTDEITMNGNAAYYALLFRTAKTKDYVYLKAGLASTNMTILESSFGVYANSQLTTSGTGGVLAIGWDIFPLRMEVESMTITLPTPTSNGFVDNVNTTTSTLTTFNLGLVF